MRKVLLISAFVTPLFVVTSWQMAKKPKPAYFDYELVIDGITADDIREREMIKLRQFTETKIDKLERVFINDSIVFTRDSSIMTDFMKETYRVSLYEQKIVIAQTRQTMENDLKILESRLEPNNLLHANLDQAVVNMANTYRVIFINGPDYRYSGKPIDAINMTGEVRAELIRVTNAAY